MFYSMSTYSDVFKQHCAKTRVDGFHDVLVLGMRISYLWFHLDVLLHMHSGCDTGTGTSLGSQTFFRAHSSGGSS